jgi:hypothetical protein
MTHRLGSLRNGKPQSRASSKGLAKISMNLPAAMSLASLTFEGSKYTTTASGAKKPISGAQILEVRSGAVNHGTGERDDDGRREHEQLKTISITQNAGHQQ